MSSTIEIYNNSSYGTCSFYSKTLLVCFLLSLAVSFTGAESKCDERFQQCLDSRRNIAVHNSYLTPSECNKRIFRIGCADISMFRVKKLPGHDRWTLLESNGKKRGLLYEGKLSTDKSETETEDNNKQDEDEEEPSAPSLDEKMLPKAVDEMNESAPDLGLIPDRELDTEAILPPA